MIKIEYLHPNFLLSPSYFLLALQPSSSFSQTLYRAPHSLKELFETLRDRLLVAVPGLMVGVCVFAIFLIAAWIGRRLIARVAPRVRADTGAVLLLSRVYFYGILTIGLLIGMQATGLNITALVAGLGLTGFAIGFALKDVLSNLLSGIMLLIYRPFHIGDVMKMGEFEGMIETIRMRDTILRAGDGRKIVIPNLKLLTEVVIVSNQLTSPQTTPTTPTTNIQTTPTVPVIPNNETVPIAPPRKKPEPVNELRNLLFDEGENKS